MTEIDPVEFGELRAEVTSLRRELDEMRDDIKLLLEVANRGKGALGMALIVGGAIGSIVTFVAKYWLR